MLKSNSFKNCTFQIKPIGCLADRTTYMAQLHKSLITIIITVFPGEQYKNDIHVKHAIL